MSEIFYTAVFCMDMLIGLTLCFGQAVVLAGHITVHFVYIVDLKVNLFNLEM